jgi:hypothetical protein
MQPTLAAIANSAPSFESGRAECRIGRNSLVWRQISLPLLCAHSMAVAQSEDLPQPNTGRWLLAE